MSPSELSGFDFHWSSAGTLLANYAVLILPPCLCSYSSPHPFFISVLFCEQSHLTEPWTFNYKRHGIVIMSAGAWGRLCIGSGSALLAQPQFSCAQSENTMIPISSVTVSINWVKYVKSLKQCLAFGMHSINVSYSYNALGNHSQTLPHLFFL